MKPLLKQILANFSVSGLTTLVETAVSIVLSILLPRFLGQSDYGVYVFALSSAGLLFGLIEFGIGVILTRDIARNPNKASEIFGDALTVRLISSGVGLFMLWASSTFVALPGTAQWVFRIIALTMCLNNITSLLIAALVGMMFFKKQLLITGSYRMISLISILAMLLVFKKDVVVISSGFLFAQTVALFLALYLVRTSIGPVKLGFNVDRWRYLIKEASPLMLSNVSANLTLRSDSVMMGVFRGAAETGIYNAAYNLLLGVGSLSSSFLYAVFPTMAKTHATDRGQAGRLFSRLFAGYAVIGICIAIGLSIYASPIILFLYGPDFEASAVPLTWLGWGIGIIILNRLTTTTLNSARLQRFTLYASLVGMILNVGLNLWVIPRWGYMGASLTTIIGEGAVLIMALFPLVNYYKSDHPAIAALKSSNVPVSEMD